MVLRPKRPTPRRPRGHPTGGRAGGPDRRAVGGAAAVAAQRPEAGPPAEVDQAAAHRRDPLADPGGRAVAGRSRAVWPVADRLWPVPPLATRRHLGKGPIRATGRGGRGRAGHLGCQRGLHRRPGAPARGRGAQKGDLQKEPPDGVGGVEPADHALGRSRGGWTTKLHLGCELGSAATAHSSPPSWNASGYPAQAVAGHAPARTGCWATRRTARKATGPTFAAAGSAASSRSRTTRQPTGASLDPTAVGHPRSTSTPTSSATLSSAASTCSSSTARWPPASTNSPYVTKPPSTSPRSTSGSAAWSRTYETRPSAVAATQTTRQGRTGIAGARREGRHGHSERAFAREDADPRRRCGARRSRS